MLQSMQSQRVRHVWVTEQTTNKMPIERGKIRQANNIAKAFYIFFFFLTMPQGFVGS